LEVAVRDKVTVRELWHLALPPGTRLVGGAAGLTNRVEWVTSLRATFPLFGAMEEGYLALARPELARRIDPRLTFSYLLTELYRVKASGLVIDEPISEEDAALADRLALPVLLLPGEAGHGGAGYGGAGYSAASEGALAALEREILRALVDWEGQLARREMEARQHLQRIYGLGGLQAVLDEVARVTAAEVVVCEQGGVVLSRTGSRLSVEAKDEEPLLLSLTQRRGARRRAMADGQEPGQAEFPILVAGKPLGRLILSTAADDSPPLTPVYGRQAADICGLEMLQQRTREETEERLGVDLVEQILDATKGDEGLLARLARLGYDISPGRRHVAVAIGAANGGAGGSDAEGCATVAQDLSWAARQDGASVLTARYRGDILVLCSLPPELPERRLRDWLRQALDGREAVCPVGVGRVGGEAGVSAEQGAGIAGLRRSVRQALGAREVGRHVNLPSPYYYEQMGLYRLLTELRGRDELARFYDETLGDLVRYDRAHGTELVRTLEAFFAENANASRTARVLYVHRNTLNYRLQRIVDITGLDLNDAEARLAFQLALKVHHLTA
jgi:PucR family transcriptional regulator, purine catabolism regulatory protein